MVSIIRGKPLDQSTCSDMVQQVHKLIDFENIRAEGIHLVGSHMLGMNNKYSDIDIILYYAYSIGDILQSSDSRIHVTNFGKQHLTECVFSVDGIDYDIVPIPVISRGSSRKELSKKLSSNDAFTLFRLVLGEELMANTKFRMLLDSILNEYTWNKNGVESFAKGITSSHINAALTSIHKTDTKKVAPVLRVSQSLIHALYYALNSISLLEDQEMYVKVEDLLDKYGLLENEGEDLFHFVHQCVKRKRDGKKIKDIKVKDWLKGADEKVRTVEKLLNDRLEVSLKETSIEDLTSSNLERNIDLIDDYIFTIYDQEV